MKTQNIDQTLNDLDSGMFMSKVSSALSQVALGVIKQGKKGKVTLTLDLSRIGESASIQVDHTLSYEKPTLRGRVREEDKTSTPLQVAPDGAVMFQLAPVSFNTTEEDA
jgi:hypothetical protein